MGSKLGLIRVSKRAELTAAHGIGKAEVVPVDNSGISGRGVLAVLGLSVREPRHRARFVSHEAELS